MVLDKSSQLADALQQIDVIVLGQQKA